VTFVSRGPGKARYRPRPRLADKRKSIFSGFCMKTRNYAPALRRTSGTRELHNNFFRILHLLAFISHGTARQARRLCGEGRCELGAPAAAVSEERSGRACATLRSLCGRDGGRGGMGDWLSGRAPRSHRGGHWFDPSIAHHKCLVRPSSSSVPLGVGLCRWGACAVRGGQAPSGGLRRTGRARQNRPIRGGRLGARRSRRRRVPCDR
jgi:hypothetical protein